MRTVKARGQRHEAQRRSQFDCFAVHARRHHVVSCHLELRSLRGLPAGELVELTRCVGSDEACHVVRTHEEQHGRAEHTAIEARTRPEPGEALQAVRVVRDDHDLGVLDDGAARHARVQPRRRRVGSEQRRQHLGDRSQLGVAILVRRHDACVDPERHVVDEHAPIHLGEVDASLARIAVGVE